MFGIEYRAVLIVALFCSFDIRCAALDNENAVPVSSVDSSLASSTISSTDDSIHSATSQAKPTKSIPSIAQKNGSPPPPESTVSSDPDLTTNSTESTSSTSKTTVTSSKTSLKPTVTSSSTSSSITPTATPISPTTNSASPPRITTVVPIPHNKRQFDGPSFIGGIILASGLMAIAFVAFKFYKARTERNYHTL